MGEIQVSGVFEKEVGKKGCIGMQRCRRKRKAKQKRNRAVAKNMI
jgi:hypothetical protein